jgi:hypothetical protein
MTWMRSFRFAVAPAIAFLMIVIGAVAANAEEFGGRYTGYNDGTFARIQGNQFGPLASHCIIFSTLASNEGGGLAQLQAGLVRCNGTALVGTCDNVKFVESINANNVATCFPHGTFSLGVYHDFKVQRTSAGNSFFQAYINGTPYEFLNGFGSSVRMWAWGERTPSAGCGSWQGRGTFKDWQKYDFSTGWVQTAGNVYPGNGCWTISGVDANRVWNVQR